MLRKLLLWLALKENKDRDLFTCNDNEKVINTSGS